MRVCGFGRQVHRTPGEFGQLSLQCEEAGQVRLAVEAGDDGGDCGGRLRQAEGAQLIAASQARAMLDQQAAQVYVRRIGVRQDIVGAAAAPWRARRPASASAASRRVAVAC